MQYNSITSKMLLLVIIVYILTAVTVISVVDYKLRNLNNQIQQKRQLEQLNLIISRLESYEKRLKHTGMEDLYVKEYQTLALSRIEDNYYKQPGQKIYPIILDHDGNPLLTNNYKKDRLLYNLTNKFATKSQQNFGEHYFSYKNIEYWCIYKNFPNWQWYIAYVIPTDLKYSNVAELRNTLIFILISSAVFSMLLQIILISRMIKPIIHLTRVADTIASGDLEQPIEVKSNDEIGKLADTFELMRQSIKEQIKILNTEVMERKQAENNLFVTLNSIGDAVITTDNKSNIIHMNPIALKLTGWKFEEAAGKPLLKIFNIININTREQCPNPVEKVLTTGEIVNLENHTVLLAKDGTEYHIADSGAPIRNEQGAILGVVLVFRDVTERYRLEAQIRQSDKMQAIGQLAGGIAHDFNNMLGGIIGAAEILHNYLDGSKTAEELHSIIVNASDRAAELTQQLLAFSRSKKIASTAINLHIIIAESLSLLKRTIDRSIIISSELNAKTDIIIGDPAQLQNIIINLGINASHAMPDGGALTLSTRNISLDKSYCSSSNFELEPGDYIELSVRDTGCGITPEHQNRIFEPFFTTKTGGKGTGLGLSAVYGSIIQHNGAISIKSHLNEGTTFYLLFPISTSTRKEMTPIKNTKPHGAGTILVIDDEQLMRTTAKAILSNAGYSVILAENGKEGLKIFRQKSDTIDLILLDMVMPVMNGKDCFRQLKEIDPEVKVILASGFSKDEDIEIMKQQNLRAFISKPYHCHELINLITEILH